MTAKLTLSIDSKIIEKAKKYAKKEGKSLSSMVEDFLAFAVKKIHF
jgi:predicted HicB family RNase H-like nuclease